MSTWPSDGQALCPGLATHLLVKELQIGGALVFDILALILIRFFLAGPGRLLLVPLFFFVFVAVSAVKLEVVLESLLPV